MSLTTTQAPLVTDAEPPFNGPKINVGGWWGCPDWLIKGDPTRSALWDWESEMPENMGKFLEACEAAAPGEDVKLRPTRLTKDNDENGRWALVGVDVDKGLGIQPIYLAFVEAVAEPDQWRWLPVPWAAGVLGGLDADGALCAFIAPARRGRT